MTPVLVACGGMTLPQLQAPDIERACALLERLYDPANVIHGKGVRIPRTFPRDDLAWLEEHGLSPNQRTKVDHDTFVERIVGAKRTRALAEGGRTFVATLDRDGPPHGAFVEAALLAHRMPAHAFERWGASKSCRVCGLERVTVRDAAEEFLGWHGAGTGIPGDAAWAALALEMWPSGRARPSKLARGRMARILLALDELPPKAHAGAAIAAVSALGFFAETRHAPASRGIVETLAFAGILEAPPHVGLATRFVSALERDARPSVRVEYDAPLGFWRGAHGVSWANARALFGITKASAARDAEHAAPAEERPTPRRPRTPVAKPARTLPRRPAEKGDVWGVRVREDSWVLVYVWKTQRGAGRHWALVEYLDWFGHALPETSALSPIGVRGRRDGRWQTRSHGLEKTTGLVLVAERVPAPKTSGPAPKSTPAGGASDLKSLADWCFPELDRL